MGTNKVFDPYDPDQRKAEATAELRKEHGHRSRSRDNAKPSSDAKPMIVRGFWKWIPIAPFWMRLALILATTFAMAFIARFKDAIGWSLLFLLLLLAELVWLGFATFRRKSVGIRKQGASPIVGRILVFLLVTPIAWPIAFGFGHAAAVAVVPLSQQEIAEDAAQTARREAQQAADDAKKAAETEAKQSQADAEAEQKARNQAASEAQAQVDAANQKASDQQKAIEDLKSTKPLAYAAKSCDFIAQAAGVPTSGYVVTDPDGTTLTLTTMSADDAYGEFIFQCISEKLNFSAPLMLSIANTNALAGVMNWAENGMDIQWTYHPDNGLNLSILKQKSCFLFICS